MSENNIHRYMKKIRIIFVLFLLIFLVGLFGFAKYISSSLVEQDNQIQSKAYEQTSIY